MIRFEEAGQYLRLTVHDELWAEVPEALAASVIEVLMEEMGKPIPELAMPPEWGLGPELSILVEAKMGKTWA